jgi:hypothetical protein
MTEITIYVLALIDALIIILIFIAERLFSQQKLHKKRTTRLDNYRATDLS